MKLAAWLLLLLVGAEAPPRVEPAIAYFTYVRQVQIAEPDRQNFFVVDQEVWKNSRPDLGDLRLYDGESPVQFAISEQRAGMSSEEVAAKMLNLGSVSGHTEFDLDAESLAEYDRIRLWLDAHDFIATASVSGGSAPAKATEVELTTATLYDFSKEQLGSNFQLKLPTSSFPFLHVRLSPGIRPEQVNRATLYNLDEQQACWTKVGSCAPPQNKPPLTIISCSIPEKVPLSRILFQVDPGQVNFRRTVSLEDAKRQEIARGEISRVRINRAGTLVTHEELSVNVFGHGDAITINVDNGDNPPLAVSAVEPLAVERRIYFDPHGKTRLRLYYGDHKLAAPIYDYARFFHPDASPAEAQLAAASPNPQYVGRADDRPWSDRHAGILWTVMIAAVLALTVLALRGLRTQSVS
jgi:hypothetical protein